MNKKELGGMTINERLFHLNLMDEFDAAVKKRDKQTLVAIYQKMEIDESGALQSIDAIFADPARYGY